MTSNWICLGPCTLNANNSSCSSPDIGSARVSQLRDVFIKAATPPWIFIRRSLRRSEYPSRLSSLSSILQESQVCVRKMTSIIFLEAVRTRGISIFPYRLLQSNQIKSFLLVYGAVKTTINDQGVVWVYGKGHQGVSFLLV